jgi:hypothetical protein
MLINYNNTMPQSDMSIEGMVHFRRDISYNIGIIPALNPRDRRVRPKRASLAPARG